MNVQTNEIRELSIDELDSVNGGIIPILAMGICFSVGLMAGAVAANYTYTDNFWGSLDD